MRTFLLLCCITATAFAADVPPTQPAASTQPALLRVGGAIVAINPEAGTPMAGYYVPRAVEGVHDDLNARALVIEQGGVKAALVVCDLITMPRGVVEKARELIAHDTNIPADHVMISATHSHTGPIMMQGLSRDPAAQGDVDKSQRYTDGLPALIARCVRDANDKLADGVAMVGSGRIDDLSHNRRYFMQDGSVAWNPGKLDARVVRPAGPIDPELAVVYFQSPGAEPKPLATYVDFAMHPDTTGGLRVSADYPYTIAKILGQVKGPEMVTLFANGTCGDINHTDRSRPYDRQMGYAEAARLGTVIAGETLKTYSRLSPVTTAGIRVRSENVKLDLPPFTPAELEKARHDATTFAGKGAPTFLEKVAAFRILDTAAREGKPLDVEVQVITLGDDVAWVALPGEIFVNLGLAIKEASPYKHTIIAELANGAIGYIPTRQAYAEGNYEPTNAHCAAGSGEKLVETAVRLLTEIKRGK